MVISTDAEFYDKNHKDYFNSTVKINSEFFLKDFADVIPANSHILDVGCGSGRDLLWLKERGHKPVGLEQSAKLANLAENHSGCQVLAADLETYDFKKHQVDGIILVGSLVHICHDKLRSVLENIIDALKPGGFMFLSLKEDTDGNKCLIQPELTEKTSTIHAPCYPLTRTQLHPDGDRTFYLWQDIEIKVILNELNLNVIKLSRNISKVRESDIWLSYLIRRM